MENKELKEPNRKNDYLNQHNNHFFSDGGNSKSNTLAGIFILVVGVLLLARVTTDYHFPKWLFSWPMILVSIGVFIGIQQNFRGPSWWILILIGSPFLAKNLFPGQNIGSYIWPLAIIGVGLSFILRPWLGNRNKKQAENGSRTQDSYSGGAINSESNSSADYIDSISIFSGTKKRVISKHFKGGEIINIFGGSEIDFTNSDIQNEAQIEVTAIFGGCKLIVPADWEVRAESVNIFGGTDDKRRINISPDEPKKILIIKGTVIFGGIDIRSY